MRAAEAIRKAVAEVARLRDDALASPSLGEAIRTVKRYQALRFAATYGDLLGDQQYGRATRFFLEELYGERNYQERDAQFGQIAGTLQRLLPNAALTTAVALAQLHALSEEFDHAMAIAWIELEPMRKDTDTTTRYIDAWRIVGGRAKREAQLRIVLEIGSELEHQTKIPGLHLMLKMMRGPSLAAGLGTLQTFLQTGFDIFASMGKHSPGATGFLAIVQSRESNLINLLFDADITACRSALELKLDATQSVTVGAGGRSCLYRNQIL